MDLRGIAKLAAASRIELEGNPELTSLAGLEHIERVPSLFYLRGNHKLIDLGALVGCHCIGSLTISNNYALVSLAGLRNLHHARGLAITSNEKLAALGGLVRLSSLDGTLTIDGNPALPPGEIEALRARLGR